MSYYPPQPVFVQRPPVVVAPQPPVIVAGTSSPAIIIDRGRRSGRSWSRSRSRSRPRSKTVYHKHTHSYKPSSRRGRRSLFKSKSKSGKSKRIKMNIGEEHSSKKATQRMDALSSSGTPVEIFLHANADHTDELPQIVQLQWAMAAAFKNKQEFKLSLKENDREVFSSQSTFNRQVTERTVDVEYTMDDDSIRLEMNGLLQFTFQDGLTQDVAVFPSTTGNPWSSVRVNLYDHVYHETFVKKQLPIAYATIKFKKSASTMSSHVVESIVVSADFNPDRETIVTHIPHIDALPEFNLTSLDVVRRGSKSYTQPLHAILGEKLRKRFAKVKHDESSRWQLISNDEGGEYGSTTSREHNVLWGEITDGLLSRIIVDFLVSSDGLSALDSTDYLVAQLSTTENGRALVSLVTRLYMDLHPERTLVDRQDFPTLRQVLRHTTGLPSHANLDYDDIVNYYKTVVAKLGEDGKEEASSSSETDDSVTEVAISNIIDHLQKFKTADVDPDVIVGEHGNIFEALILFMYFQASMQRTPLDAINQLAQENSIELVWGLVEPTNSNDPLSLLTCAKSKFDDLVKFARMIYNDLERQDSIAVQTLLDPVYLRRGEAIARTVGWYVLRTANDIDIIFSWQGKHNTLGTTLIYFVPELRAWGIINEFTNDFKKALCFDSSCFVNFLAKSIDRLGDEVTGDSPRHAIEHVPYSVYSHKYKVSELTERHLSLVNGVYEHPFSDSTTGEHAQVSVMHDPDTGNLVIVDGLGGRPTELGYTGHDDVFFRVAEPFKRGNDIVITPEYIGVRGIFFLAKKKVNELYQTYKKALAFAKQKISMDIHGDSRSHHLHHVKAHSMIASQFFEEPIGRPWRGGRGPGFGAGVAVGALGGLGAAALYSPRYYGYRPYGYRYAYPPDYYPVPPYGFY